ncbi:MAG: YihY family inner membrane protein [Defluviitaleaceae bacterium]|nr:YihY family inner membrane protein [Defluviitaleaceae bacterium]
MSTVKQFLMCQLKKKEIQAIPEVLAFNFMMALIPLLIIFFQILAFLSIETTLLDETITQYLPSELYDFMMEFLETASLGFSNNPLLIAVTVCTLTLTISKGVNGIFKAFLITYDETVDVPGYKQRLASILTFFLLLGFSAFATFLITISHVFLTYFHPVLKTTVELIIFTLVCFTFFFLLFKLAPNKKKALRQLLPGCILTTTGFIITTTVFTYYVDRLANFHLVYGSLAIIIILLTWLYLVGWVINLGIQLNYVLQMGCDVNNE